MSIALGNLDKCEIIIKQALDDYCASALANPNEFALSIGRVAGQLEMLAIGAKLLPAKAASAEGAAEAASASVVEGEVSAAAVNRGAMMVGGNI